MLSNLHRTLPSHSRFGIAFMLFIVAFMLRYSLFSLDSGLTYVTFYPALIASFYVCGFWAGWFTVALSGVTALYVFGDPHWAFPSSISGYTGSLFFLLTSTLVAITTHKLQEVQASLNERLQIKAAQLTQTNYDLIMAKKASGAAVWHWNITKNSLDWDPEMFKLFELRAVHPTFELWRSVVHPDDIENIEGILQNALIEKSPFACSYRIILPNGNNRWIDVYGAPYLDAEGKAVQMAGICIDSSKLNESLTLLREHERRFRYLFDNLPVAYQALDEHGCWLDANQKMAELLGFDDPQQMIGLKFIDYWDESNRIKSATNVDTFRTVDTSKKEILLKNRTGALIYANVVSHIERDARGNFIKSHSIVTNITEYRTLENELKKLNAELEFKVLQRTDELKKAVEAQTLLAREDGLTRLPNRLAANERIHTEFVGMKRRNHSYAILMLDIDHFKHVNDTYGHAVGDGVLQMMADSLKNSIRADDFACRFGGEEFLILLPDTNIEDACQVAEKIRTTISALKHHVAGSVTVSIGVSLACAVDVSEDIAIKRADEALYDAKHSGRNQVKIYTMNEQRQTHKGSA